jgi:hypothetical protein
MGEKGNAYRVLMGNLQVKRQLGRPRLICMMKNNNKLNLREIRWDSNDSGRCLSYGFQKCARALH